MDQLQSERCYLVQIEDRDIDAFLPFFGEKANLYFYLPTELRTYKRRELVEELETWSDGQENLAWAIRLQSGETIGIVNLEGIDSYNLNAELGIMLLGPEYRGVGYASEVCREIIRYSFEDNGLRRLTCRVMSGNQASFNLVKSLGFRQEGIMLEAQKRPDTFLDMYYFGLLKSEWLEYGGQQ